MDRIRNKLNWGLVVLTTLVAASSTLLTMHAAIAQSAQPQQQVRSAPRAVSVARATEIPACNVFVDASVRNGNGTASQPFSTISAAVAASNPGAAICVAEGIYPEQIKPGAKHFALAGGFQRGQNFKVRDSARFPSKAAGRGGSFIIYQDAAPQGEARTVIDGFEITGYERAIVRDYHVSGRFDLTNNYIHGNACRDPASAGAGFALINASGRIQGNVIRNNRCGRGGGGFVNDTVGQNTIVIEGNLIDGNAGTEPDSSHGGGLYLFATSLRITANLFINNSVTQWGGGLYIGADAGSGQRTNAQLNWNVYRSNKAGNSGGGLFCDDGAKCTSFHEIFDRNCGGNILLDSGTTDATGARFEHLTNVSARKSDCRQPGHGIAVNKGNTVAETYTIIHAIFWGNATGGDLFIYCDQGCSALKVNIAYSLVQRECADCNLKARFGEGIVVPVDPLFADAEKGDFHLKSTFGRWTPRGYVQDSTNSPAIGKGLQTPANGDSPVRAGRQIELGAYGNSVEASLAN